MFDAYVRRARFYPAVIAAAPAFALATILVSWNSFGMSHLIATGGMAVLLAVMSDVARRRGRAIEPKIIDRMNGLPSKTMMRFRDDTFDYATKVKMHTLLASKIKSKAPTIKGEQSDPAAADDFYKRCGNWLRENTRDRKKFKILFEENVTYGFRRNLLGLKWPALTLNAFIVILSVAIVWLRSPLDLSEPTTQKLLVVIVVAFLHAAYFFLFVNESGVIEASKIYARQLLLSTETVVKGTSQG